MTETTKNMGGGEHCRWCDDEGWVELKGTITQHGTTYSRGSAPCKWCEQGARRWQRMRALRLNDLAPDDKARCNATDRLPVETDYGEDDVEPALDYQPVSKAEARGYIAAILDQWAQPRPGEEAFRRETQRDIEAKRKLIQDLEAQFETKEAREEIERKKRLAQQALDAGKGTVELPPDPAPPAYDEEMPF